MFLDILDILFRENFFENVFSEIYQKNYFCSQKTPKIVNVFMFFFIVFFCIFSKSSFVEIKAILWLNLRPHFQKKSLNNFFVFTVNSQMSKNMCKLRHKVCNGHFYPMKVQISSISKLFSN